MMQDTEILEQPQAPAPTAPAPALAREPAPPLVSVGPPRPARPASGAELDRAERIALAEAIETGNGALPPNVDTMIQSAPESFRDLRLGKIAACVRAMREQNLPVHPESVAAKSQEVLFIATELAGSVVSRDIAELEAGTALAAYLVRRMESIAADTGAALRLSPAQFKTIAHKAIFSLNELLETCGGESLAQRLALRLYNPQTNIVRPAPRYSIGRVTVCTPGNLTTISAQAKSGKTAVMGAMVGSTFAGQDADCLGFISGNEVGRAVLHIDTEQSPFDHGELVRLIAQRAGRPLPSWFKSYCLTGWPADEIRRAIPVLMELASREHGGIHSVLLDGSGDIANDVNDPKESNSIVAELHALAIQYDCSIITAIHLNPASDTKTRGHLGSQLERKGETNLQITKDDEICTLYASKNRHAPILKSTGPRFAWNEEHGMHRSIESQADAKADAEFDELSSLFQNALSNHPSMSHADLKTTVAKAVSVVPRTAERKIARAVTLGILKKTFGGLYELMV